LEHAQSDDVEDDEKIKYLTEKCHNLEEDLRLLKETCHEWEDKYHSEHKKVNHLEHNHEKLEEELHETKRE
jgi:peptidoglycan hydrolase CwlO-like protein